MKQLPLILSIVALCLASMALYKLRSPKVSQPAVVENKSAAGNNFKIAYFEMDSLEVHYDYFKDAQTQVKVKENAMNSESSELDHSNQKKIEAWRQKGNKMTQAEGEAAQQEYAQMQQTFASRKQALEQDLTDMRNKKLRDIQIKIEEYLKEYNKQKGYAYIFSYEPAVFIYYKDPAYNITPELLVGLNEAYNKTKSK